MSVIENQQQFISLFSRHYKFLCMIAMHYVHDAATAEDIVQDFFIDYWENRRGTLIKVSFEAYSARAVKNKSISVIRSQHTQEKRLNQFGNETYTEIEEDSTGFDKDALQMEVLRLIEQLPAERKKILLMSSRDRLSNQEIADQLGISINTVKSQIYKSYNFIRENVNLRQPSNNGDDTVSILSNTAILLALLSVS
ncbi:hypothetical protein CPT03_07120 [Pedobacter ginsengisoli]|uniref:RNA polymerase sigma-70 factor n=1 Tax=Pedobacter ginsengisoli TaxID=363852 RepID=A0A2D1U3S8_9SPHI|nr:RNA polymerase sigma-70 factor [Pedobacter ginsengisoli]ATP56256.1 hypothetical protein CPT03_07120 [Pedobacter ginsengisoli]